MNADNPSYVSCADQVGRVVNPEAIGDPEQTPIVAFAPEQVEAMMAAGIICRCGGMNGFHRPECGGATDIRAVTVGAADGVSEENERG